MSSLPLADSSAPLAPRNSAAAIDRVLAGIDARLLRQHRVTLKPKDVIAVPKNSVTLVYVINGTIGVDTLSRAAQYTSGDALLFTGQHPHSLRTSDPAFIFVSSLDFTESAAHLLALLPDTITVRDLLTSEPAVAALASQLGPDVSYDQDPCADQIGSSVVCKMMANTVLVTVIRAWVLRGCAPAGWPSSTNDPFLDRVVEAIHADPGKEWTLDTLAKAGAMSRSSFAERFRSATGVSPVNYVTEVRIRSAQELLAQGVGVSEVSRMIGYGSDDGFSRAFRRHVGKSPSAWRIDATQTPAA
ncbi:AraC family transcriptional regulator [Leucobacter coleopterorum]|uniref:AraC family transcriptional regulator n=1 Tax=Leucobacter coleopterorum TaxID=2714933 RepID=A0ABX6JUH8_9MICO|nr:AraC family transcriptional regulator [Leucobacter coleopterorum]QIM17951.1 AraC family transcriptional regulator [Leucobacter coleopterorum]